MTGECVYYRGLSSVPAQPHALDPEPYVVVRTCLDQGVSFVCVCVCFFSLPGCVECRGDMVGVPELTMVGCWTDQNLLLLLYVYILFPSKKNAILVFSRNQIIPNLTEFI